MLSAASVVCLYSCFEICCVADVDLFRYIVLNDIHRVHMPILPQKWGWKALSRSYGRFFAEFLEKQSLVRIGLLDLNTGVGLRYGVYMVRA